MATVYLAHDVRHDRKVALKVLKPELAAVIGAERFLHEIKTTANLQHPHILPLFDSGEADTFLYYVMPNVEGESLRDRLNREKQLGIEDAIEIARAVAGALDYAHRHGVIHRDIKPENILLHDGQALVADFGIALAVSQAGSARLTETGLSIGTPQYMSPEQAMGDRELDARSDIYSLAAMLYEMLAGDPPYTGSTAQAIVAKVITEKALPVTVHRDTVPPHVAAALQKALSKLPADRFATAAGFAEALVRPGMMPPSIATGPVQSAPSGPLWSVIRSPKTAWGLLVGALAVIAMLVVRQGQRTPAAAGPVVRAVLELPAGLQISYPRLALSRDGTLLVVNADSAGVGRLYLHRMDRLDFAPVAGSEQGSRQFLSPDGRWVGFYAGQLMKKVPLDGGGAIAMDSSAWAGGDWREDGEIVYSRSYVSGLWRIRAEGGGGRALTTPDSSRNELAHWWPQFLPDGEHVLFTVMTVPVERARIEAISLETGARTVIVEGGVSGRYVPTGHLLYAKGEVLFAVPFDVERLRVTGQAVPVLEDLAMSHQDALAGYAVSDDGTLAYVQASVYRSPTELVWVTRSGKESRVPLPEGTYEDPALSPDGSRLAMTVRPPREPTDVWMLDLVRGALSRITTGGGGDFAPNWTPQGDRVIYTSERPVYNLYWRPADGSRPSEPLLESRFDKFAISFTPDGGTLLFNHSTLPNAQVWTLPLAGGTPAPLVATGGADVTQGSLDPAGRWLAYVSNESGRFEVYLAPYPDVTSRRIQVSTTGGGWPRWVRGGREIVYVSGEWMVAVPVDPVSGSLGVPVRLFSVAPYSLDVFTGRPFSLTSDGDRFIMVKRTPGREPRRIVVVTNWFAELAKVGRQ
jgi:serine/threonine-protein kinase